MPADMRFGEAVAALLEERGYTLRSQRIRTGIAHSTVRNWIDGVKPSWEAVVQFAEGLDLNVNEWLALAGYTPQPATGEDEELLAALDEFEKAAEAAGWEGAVIAHQGGTSRRSAADRAADLRAWAEKLREMAAEP